MASYFSLPTYSALISVSSKFPRFRNLLKLLRRKPCMHMKYLNIIFYLQPARTALWQPLFYWQVIAVYSEILTKQHKCTAYADFSFPPPWRNSPQWARGFLIIEASRSHSDTPHSVRLLWTSDRLDAETST
jgi:hypothetical protein